MITFETALSELPLIAILRHLDPASAVDIGLALRDQGFRLIEVPLNDESTALRCIELLRGAVGDDAVIGAGTVVSAAQVFRVQAAGGRLIVSPNIDPEVVGATREAKLASCPGVLTATEAFQALDAGADVIKLFPASQLGTGGLTALLDVLPTATRLVPVGGVSSDTAGRWRAAGAAGLGIGSSLYRPGSTVNEVAVRAAEVVTAWTAAPDLPPP